MKAVACHASDLPLVLEERPQPIPGPGEVLVRIRRCGICGSELHLRDSPPRAFPGGLVMGHEFSGEVASLGPAVEELAVGDLVALYPALGCGDCHACAGGNEILCGGAKRLLGGFAEFACVPARSAIRLPAELTPADGALVEPLAVAYHGVKAAALSKATRVLVLGAGSIALGAIFWARRAGAGRIVAMSRTDRRADLAIAMGADAFVPYGEDEVREVGEALGGAPEVVIECAGVPGMLGRGITHCAPFGSIVSLGFSGQPDPLIPANAGMKDLTLRFPVGYTRADFRLVAETMLGGHVDPKIMISSIISLEELPQTFARLMGSHNETKVQVDLNGPAFRLLDGAMET